MTSALFAMANPLSETLLQPDDGFLPLGPPQAPPLERTALFTSDALHGRKPCKALTRLSLSGDHFVFVFNVKRTSTTHTHHTHTH